MIILLNILYYEMQKKTKEIQQSGTGGVTCVEELINPKEPITGVLKLKKNKNKKTKEVSLTINHSNL